MTKKMRELQAEILRKTEEAEANKADVDKALSIMDEVANLMKQYELEERLEKAGKATVPAEPQPQSDLATGFTAMTKMLTKQALTDTEKALISGTDAANGENYLIPEDVRTAINELRRSYVSARSLVNVISTTSLSGSFTYESGESGGLINFSDGGEIANGDEPTFVQKAFTVKWYGIIIPLSRILKGAEKAGLMAYLDRWFVRNAVQTENTQIFATLKAGYNSGTPKALTGWKALKKSIAVDIDPACKVNGVIVTNQSGFAALDEEEDKDGRPVLQPNPAHPTEKLFQGLPVHVFPDAQLANIDATHFPVIYGNTQAACSLIEHQSLEFSASEHAGFTKNQEYLRVIEGFDVISTDTGACIYGSFAATTA